MRQPDVSADVKNPCQFCLSKRRRNPCGIFFFFVSHTTNNCKQLKDKEINAKDALNEALTFNQSWDDSRIREMKAEANKLKAHALQSSATAGGVTMEKLVNKGKDQTKGKEKMEKSKQQIGREQQQEQQQQQKQQQKQQKQLQEHEQQQQQKQQQKQQQQQLLLEQQQQAKLEKGGSRSQDTTNADAAVGAMLSYEEAKAKAQADRDLQLAALTGGGGKKK